PIVREAAPLKHGAADLAEFLAEDRRYARTGPRRRAPPGARARRRFGRIAWPIGRGRDSSRRPHALDLPRHHVRDRVPLDDPRATLLAQGHGLVLMREQLPCLRRDVL